MTRGYIEEVVKRYRQIKKAMRERKETAVFYVGGRKYEIAITCEVKAIFEIIEEIQAYENTEYMISMIKRWKQGSSDKSIMNDKPISRNAYYDRKEKFINKIFDCCIYRGYVKYEEIMEEKIGKEQDYSNEGRSKERTRKLALSDSVAYRAIGRSERDKVR